MSVPSSPSPTRRERSGDARTRRRTSRRRWMWVGGTALVLLVAAVAWIGIRGLMAKSDLEGAQNQIGALKKQALAFDVEGAGATLDAIAAHTSRAAVLTGDPVWRVAEYIPLVGPNLTAVRELAAVTDETIAGVVRPLLSAVSVMDPGSLQPKDGAIDLAPFVAAAEPVSKANASLQRVLTRAEAIPDGNTLGPVRDARTKVVGMLTEISPMLSALHTVIPLLPTAMGAEGPRYYALMFQNPAEPRALGGAALSFTLLEVDNGKLSLVETVAASTGAFSKYPESVIPIPDGAEKVYPSGEFGTFIAEASARPSFTTAGEMVTETWKRQFGQDLDGVVSIDPIALGYVLRATGPIKIAKGDVLDENSLVPLLLNGVYLRYGDFSPKAANRRHDALYAKVVSAVFGALTGGDLDAKKLMSGLAQGWDERRILFWSAHPEEESQIAKLGLNGELPITDDSTVRAGLYLQDSIGSKLSFYLRQSVSLSHGGCFDDGRTYYRVAVDLTNTLDAAVAPGLPFHITGEWARVGAGVGVNRMTIRLYAPPGSEIVGATVDGAPIALEDMHDTDYPVGKTVVEVQPGGRLSLVYYFALEGDASRNFEAQITPLVTPTKVKTPALDCASVPRG
ncbi:DUF4012 domain-containing protein [Microbacterium sp. NPDC056044]|uniref:DUF4012 domain-containing protein n=1 Tax=Microbacterium sp. NPDC056044 TaxID=3345690 RepID=UPI0035DBC487